MNRREALSSVAILMGGTIVGSHAFLSCSPSAKRPVSGILNEDQIAFLNEFCEVILPKTATTPGASEVNVGAFINDIVSDFYSEAEKQRFMTCFDAINGLSDTRFGNGLFKKDFSELNPEEKNQLVAILESEATQNLKAIREGALDEERQPVKEHSYILIKQLAIWGYLSSEAVARTAFNHLPVPGPYQGCVPLNPSDKAIFTEPGQGQARGYAVRHLG